MKWPHEYAAVKRQFATLVGVLAVATAILLVAVFLHFSSELRERRRIEQYHVRTLNLVSDVQANIVSLERSLLTHEGPFHVLRGTEATARALDQQLELVEGIQTKFADPVFAGSVGRTLQRCGRFLSALESGQDLVATERQLASLELSVRQLDRLHSAALEAGLRESDARWGRRQRLLLAYAAGLVVMTSLFVFMLFVQMRAQLNRQVETEHALQESQAELLQRQKLDALGALVGGVAHDFNNILTAILGNSERLLLRLDPDDPRVKEVTGIYKAGERAASLTRQLLQFSRKGRVESRTVDLNLLLRDLVPMLKRLMRAEVTLDMTLSDDTGCVLVDPTQVEQVVMNLVVNACDAMPDGGVLEVRTERIELSAGSAEALGLQPGTCAHACFQDTGEGISPEIAERVFEPFFTTKEARQGTGLGLSSVHGIVTRAGGAVRIDSQLGRGTSVHVYLPSHEPVAEEAPLPRPVGATKGTESVLLVEDEEQIREVAAAALRNAGYDVVTAADAPSALQLFEDRRGEIDLVVTDVVMPGMRGPELVQRLHAHSPDLGVVYLSGYTEERILDPILGSKSPFVPKPFRLQHLLQVVRKELDEVRA